MKLRRITPILVLALILPACSDNQSSDRVEVTQPPAPDGIDEENIADPFASDEGLQAAYAACKGGTEVKGRAVRVASTVAPITNLVGIIAAGTDTKVTGIVPEGTNSHTFEPPPSAAQTLETSDIVFMNGLSLEEPTREMADANATNAVLCELGTATLAPSLWLYDFSFPKAAGKPNPHLWTNPPMALSFATVIRDALVNADPSNVDIYDKNYEALSSIGMQLDEAMSVASATVPANQRKLLTYHDAYAYFSVHYGYTVIGAIQPSSFDDPTPKEIANLITQVRESGVKAVFGSEVFPSPVLEQIGAETSVRYIDVLRDDDLIGEPGDAEHSWLGLMRFNYVTMVEALGGDASALKTVDVSDVVKDNATYPQ
jgi:ABC-type Zn uptake system ZnuABC Zn-binding protein ZnuA